MSFDNLEENTDNDCTEVKKSDISELEELIEKMVKCEVQVENVFGMPKECQDYVRSPLNPQKINRQSSWKSPKRVMRRVSFADSVGLELASIRIMTAGRDTPPDLEGFHEVHRFSERQTPKPLIEPLFKQPIQDFTSFFSKLNSNSVALESTAIVDSTINGVVKVKNLSYEKRVSIVYTTDSWKTKSTVPCFYINCMNNASAFHQFDAFSFQLQVPPTCRELEFCIEYQCAGQNYWDNNGTKNYKLICNRN